MKETSFTSGKATKGGSGEAVEELERLFLKEVKQVAARLAVSRRRLNSIMLEGSLTMAIHWRELTFVRDSVADAIELLGGIADGDSAWTVVADTFEEVGLGEIRQHDHGGPEWGSTS